MAAQGNRKPVHCGACRAVARPVVRERVALAPVAGAGSVPGARAVEIQAAATSRCWPVFAPIIVKQPRLFASHDRKIRLKAALPRSHGVYRPGSWARPANVPVSVLTVTF